MPITTIPNTGLATAGSLVLLSSQTASSDTAIEFDGLLTDTYKSYMLIGFDIVMGTDGSYIGFQFKRDGQTDYNTGASDYSYVGDRTREGAEFGSKAEDSTASLIRTRFDGDNANSHSFRAFIFPRNSNYQTKMFFNCSGDTSAGNLQYDVGAGNLNQDAACQSIKIISTSGNINGSFNLYGVNE